MGKSTIFFLPFLVLFSAFPPSATPLSYETDLASLIAFKSLLQDPLGSLNSWNKATHFCNWTGIGCSGRRPNRVISISLRSQGLVGSLSPHVGNLSFLTHILLQNNSFHGPIPKEISLLRKLEVVEFSNNSFSGAIPQNLSRSLVVLNLIDNKLSGSVPSDVGSMSELETLALSSNKLKGSVPPSVGNLTLLKTLSLAYCGLQGEIPASFGLLQRLEFLQLSGNGLTGTISTALVNLSKIEFFDVSRNQLEGVLPSTLGLKLPNCNIVMLAENQLHGSIPASISNASVLEYLELYSNFFTGQVPRTLARLTHLRSIIFSINKIEDDIEFISSFSNSTNLETLQVDNNLLTGSLPNSIANLSAQLRQLSLGANELDGKIPSAIGNLVGLTILELSYNFLEGPIPISIAKNSNLHYFAAKENRIVGELPSSIGNLTSLLYLYLGGNKFTGNLPPSIGNCKKLLDLDISVNNFSGLIPLEIMSISTLSISLDLSNNLFEGSIPNEVGSLRNLATLDLSYNRLSGLIPGSLSGCSSLQVLDLTGNFLEGEIPSELSALAGLQNLSLSQNNLSGPIPTFLGNLDLHYLNLSFNRLEGGVPRIGIFKNRTSISLDGNKGLCGGISELKLPPCPEAQSHKKTFPSSLKILIPVLTSGAIFVTVVAAFKYTRRSIGLKNETPSLSSFTAVEIMRFSFADLLKATGGFSDDNLLGSGKFGSVYKGILDEGHREIAVKVLNLSVRGASRSFEAECSALRNARHRNLLKILSVCESIDFQGNDFKALVYEFKANGSLEKWLHHGEHNPEGNNLNLMQRLNIAIDIAEGIEYLHSGTDSCIVHGDLKPSNILLDHDMTACVGDFGLSKLISDIIPSHESSSSVGIRGTIGYVPPEYGMNFPVSVQGDVYSFGIILLEMFTDKRPTDDLSENHVNLHSFVSAALPNQVIEVVDLQFQAHIKDDKIKGCLASILRIGVSCSKEIPRERMSMTDAVNELRKIQRMLSS